MKNLLILLVFVFTNCKKPAQTAPLPNEERILTDIAYGSHPLQKMDVYLPKNRSASTIVIIYLHGGGWYMGDKADIRDGAIYFQQQGFAFVSINYRLTKTAENNIHPAQMQDIDKVMSTIAQNKQNWSLPDPAIALFGGSAGAHLSMLYAYKYNTAGKVKAVLSMAGPTDLTDSSLIQSTIGGLSIGGMIESYIGAPLAAQPGAWRDASPVYYITAALTPTFFAHGTLDTAVPFQQSQRAHDRFSAAGGQSLLEPLLNVGHDLAGTDWGQLLPKMINFLNVHCK